MNRKDRLLCAKAFFTRFEELHPPTHYTGILALHALSRLALASGNPAHLDAVRKRLLAFVRGTGNLTP
ncbi:MAG: hypothetical protein U1E27_03735, partial [Kiritimatiellia bacterium]|nr:hypothetical protein [Kiritimatiellia bacterium]